MPSTRTIRIAGAQLACRLNRRIENFARAGELATRAAAAGAQLVLFPELMPSGYTISPRLWQGVEPADGPTARWLRRTSAELGIYLGTSYPELDCGHIYNTFVLTTADGREAGRVRKSHTESYLFRGEPNSHVIECDLGRIGVGICADNHYADFARLMRRSRVDLMLMPHAGPAGKTVGGLISQADIHRQHDVFQSLAPRYAEMLGAPALFVNQCGRTSGERGTGIVGSVLNSPACYFPGLTTLADSGGRVVARLGGDDGLVIGDVTVDRSRYPEAEPRLHGAFVTPGSWFTRHVIFTIDGCLGKMYYARRRTRAGVQSGERAA
ncbi:MAG: carbon-nitrogen hydrolase family protein [Dactylosporangium sp.]|nr:carbon-nitrogen hydrolase family protein [Dactylosporangium sp.]NNJ60859.1 carbon-nitrogen hydrolase family protein [Dactylosporangium sp.]